MRIDTSPVPAGVTALRRPDPAQKRSPAAPSGDPDAVLALDRLKQLRAEAPARSTALDQMRDQAKAKQREALAEELRRLTDQVRSLSTLFNPDAVGPLAARLAKQIASVAKALAALSQKEPGGGPAPGAPAPSPDQAIAEARAAATQSADPAAAEAPSAGEGAGDAGNPVPQQGAIGQGAVAVAQKGSTADPAADDADTAPDDTGPDNDDPADPADTRPADLRDLLARYLRPEDDQRVDPLRTKSVKQVLEEAWETILDLKALMARARDAVRRRDGTVEEGVWDTREREVTRAAAEIADLLPDVDPAIRVSSGLGGGTSLSA